MRWLRRILALWAAYTIGHWVGWGVGRTEPRTYQGGMDDTWSNYYKETST